MSSSINNLKRARNRAGMTQAEASEASGIPIGTLRRWEQGVNEPDIASIILLADTYKTTTDELLGSRFSGVIKARPVKTILIPVLGRIAAGEAREAIQQADEWHATRDELWRGHERAFWLVVAGNSMNRLFPEGALVLIDPDMEIRDGDVGAVFVNGDDATLKRVFYDGDAVRLHPESYDPEYRDRTIDRADPDAPEFRSIGRAISYAAPDGWRA
mgnify:CR=1 FL=1